MFRTRAAQTVSVLALAALAVLGVNLGADERSESVNAGATVTTPVTPAATPVTPAAMQEPTWG
ncbi:hypothetical protein ACN20G_11395 [Streptomyces sp. BI20]|uniref:hypothetical protein n=1 Tax=Streptomyces sp. BI20 TaxID=3403460 RepID=UPI003C778837